ncbi:MAG TPA: hypothetical protein VGS08_06050 [Candidatus Saccharimonadales bacterium]|nr:hypothetical protein [Candidatus Saccharimonadales bacterium]
MEAFEKYNGEEFEMSDAAIGALQTPTGNIMPEEAVIAAAVAALKVPIPDEEGPKPDYAAVDAVPRPDEHIGGPVWFHDYARRLEQKGKLNTVVAIGNGFLADAQVEPPHLGPDRSAQSRRRYL